MLSWITLCTMDELKEGLGKYVEVQGYRLAVFLHEGEPFVTDNSCPHAGGSMSGGHITGTGSDACAICPWHGWGFQLTTGNLTGGWDAEVLKVYPTRRLPSEGKPDWVQAQLKQA